MEHDAQESPSAAQAGKKWVVVKEWSGGRGRLETEKFKTTSPWRVSWKATSGDPDPIGSVSIAVRKATGELVKLANNLGQKILAGNLAISDGGGEYYLEIESADRNWQVTVEQEP
jgi:hypothetical protein